MAYICTKPPGSCPKCGHFRRDEDRGRMACFAKDDERKAGKPQSKKGGN